MPTDVRVPTLGESVVEATVGSWLKREGETVEAGEPLVQLETEKVNVDVSADAPGVLGQIAHQAGETVRPGDVLATITPSTASSSPSPLSTVTPEPETQAVPLAESVERPHASPVARRIADERGLCHRRRRRPSANPNSTASRATCRRSSRDPNTHDPPPPDDRPTAARGAAHGGHADDLQRGRHDGHHGHSLASPRGVSKAPWRGSRVHVLLYAGCHRRAQGVS